jgi:hypothetical protein
MIRVLNDKREAIADLCRRYRVKRLDVFGSAADSPDRSEARDVDLIIEFLPGTPLGPWLSEYFELKRQLEHRLGRCVDLVMADAMRNPHFVREANRTRRNLYEAENA